MGEIKNLVLSNENVIQELHSVQVMQYMTFVEIQVKWSVTLTDRLCPEILTVLEIKFKILRNDPET